MIGSRRLLSLVLSLSFALLELPARAESGGLADLKTALARLQGQGSVKAVVDAKTWRRRGEGKEAAESNAQFSLAVEDGSRGLQMTYGKELLARLESEQKARVKNPNAKAPTVDATRELGASEVRSLLSAAPELTRILDRAVFKGEKNDTFKGQSARMLSFTLPMESLPDEARKYVKEYSFALDIWIGADGVPLASSMHQALSGRAFLVVSFDQSNDEECIYGLAGDHLVTLRKESKNLASGAGEKDDSKSVKTLQLQS